MGLQDWGDLGSSLSTASLRRGATAAFGGASGSFAYGYNSLDGTVTGAHGKFVDLTNYNPVGDGPAVTDGGTSMRGAVKRISSPSATGFTPLLFACAQGGASPSVNDDAYLLGLSDADPYEIMLAKGPIVSGLVASDENLYVLGTSSEQYAISDDLWHHLRLDAIVQPNGDVLLKVFKNEGDVLAPTWEAIGGISADGVIDDVLGYESGSVPLWGGCAGWAFCVAEGLNRRGAFDVLQLGKLS